jgi:hypothetical protein
MALASARQDEALQNLASGAREGSGVTAGGQSLPAFRPGATQQCRRPERREGDERLARGAAGGIR